jgi:hypothetical protein
MKGVRESAGEHWLRGVDENSERGGISQPTGLSSCAVVIYDRVPISIGLGLIFRHNLERERFIVLERGPPV